MRALAESTLELGGAGGSLVAGSKNPRIVDAIFLDIFFSSTVCVFRFSCFGCPGIEIEVLGRSSENDTPKTPTVGSPFRICWHVVEDFALPAPISERPAREADFWKLFSDLPILAWKTRWKTRRRREEDAWKTRKNPYVSWKTIKNAEESKK